MRKLTLALLLLTTVACGEGAKKPVEKAETHAEGGKDGSINVVIEKSYPPFVYKDEFGSPRGMDIDVLKAIGSAVGADMNFKSVSWDKVYYELETGGADVAASGILPDANNSMFHATEPYVVDSVVHLTKGSEPGGAFGVQAGTFEHPGATEYKTAHLAFAALQQDSVDTLVSSRIVAKYEALEYPDLPVRSYETGNELPVVFLTKEERVKDTLNRGLEIIKKSGEYDKIVAGYGL